MPADESNRPRALETTSKVKNFIVIILLAVMLFLVALTTVELLVEIIRGFLVALSEPVKDFSLLNEGLLLELLGLILTIFIALELVESTEIYLTEHSLHADIVILVAIIAVCRKLIIIDYKEWEPLSLMAMALIVAALGGAYLMLHKARPTKRA